MKRNLKELIESLGFNFKLEILKLILINVVFLGLAVVSILIFNQLILCVLAVFVDIVGTFFFLARYGDIDRKNNERHNTEFISLLSYFEIFIGNNKNVYTAFQLLIPYASTWMQERIEDLLKEINVDKSVQPFVNFSNNFSHRVIQSVMLSIFQMVDSGENDESMNQFNYLFITMSTNQQIELKKSKESKLDNLNVFPLIGAGAITVILIFSILVIVGGMINGI